MYIRIDRESSLFKLLTDFLTAYNRRTDVMEASTDLSVQRQVDQSTAGVKAVREKLQASVDSQTKGE